MGQRFRHQEVRPNGQPVPSRPAGQHAASQAERGCSFARKGSTCMDAIRLFAGIPEDEKQALLARSTFSTHAKGEVLVHQGDDIDSVIIVCSGRIKTFRSDADGNEYVLDVLHDGQALWHGMFLDDHVYHYDVGCLTKVDVCHISRDAFLATVGDHPEMALGLIRMLSTELDEAEEKVMTLGIRDPRRRIAQFLLWRDERCIGPDINLKLDDIAGSMGLRTETVSRIITQLEREGLIRRMGRGKIRVIDRDGLAGV